MTKRILSTDSTKQAELENALTETHGNYLDSFEIVHLIKFEKPKKMGSRDTQNADRYFYFTDSGYDIDFRDQVENAAGVRHVEKTYKANKLLTIGTVNENIQAKASSMTIKLDANSLGLSTTSFGKYTSSTTFEGNTNFADLGFQEGDTITSSQLSEPLIIESFINDGLGFTFSTSANMTTVLSYVNNVTFTFNLTTEALNALLAEKSETGYTNYINRDIYIYKAHINPTTRQIIGEPFIYFKGIVTNGTLDEKLTGSVITWSVTSHWGDFLEVNARYADDNTHRALNARGASDSSALIRDDYKSDLGFLHANTSIYQNIRYMGTKEEWYEGPDGTVFGWGTGPILSKDVPVERNTYLNITMNSKSIPVVYGVRKVQSWPVFVDTDSTNTNNVYKVDAICEGEIASVYDVQIEGQSVVCNDVKDSDVRGIIPDPITGEDVIQYADDAEPGQVCYGNKRRGDVIGKATWNYQTYQCSYPDADVTPHQVAMNRLNYTGSGAYIDSSYEFDINDLEVCLPSLLIEGDSVAFSRDAVGLQHDDPYKVPVPSNMNAEMIVHTGKPEQKTDMRFVSVAADSNKQFTIQKNYYDASFNPLPYWSTSHKLLDTAYISQKITIGDGETTIPNYDFVIKGKLINCYSYDNSFGEPVYQTQQSETELEYFTIGREVGLYTENGGDQQSAYGNTHLGDVTIQHTFNSLEPGFGNANKMNKRFIFSDNNIDFSGVRHFAMRFVDSNGVTRRWILQNNDQVYTDSAAESHTQPGVIRFDTRALPTTGTNFGVKIPLQQMNGSVLTSDQEAMLAAFAKDDSDEKQHVARIRVYKGAGSNRRRIGGMSTFGWDSATNSLDDVNIDVTGLGSDLRVEIINAINIDMSEADDLNSTSVLLGATVEFTRTTVNTDGDTEIKVQENKVVDSAASNKYLLVEKNWEGDLPGSDTSNESYKVKTPKDFRASLNPAMQLLDYMTSDRYGKGLRVDKEIDLNSFKESARACDVRSDVSMFIKEQSNAVDINQYVGLGERWGYPSSQTATKQWLGTVKSIGDRITVNNVSGRVVTFTDCAGKLSRKWNSYTQYFLDELYWYDGYLYEGSGTVEEDEPYSGALNPSNGLTIHNTATNSQDIAKVEFHPDNAGPDGNPLIKNYDPVSQTFDRSGYSLYDSDNIDFWRMHGWDDESQYSVTRHQFNQIVDTKIPIFDNINKMLQQFNGVLRYSAGLYNLSVKGKKSTLDAAEQISEEDIIGTIKLSDKGLKNSKNYMTASILDPGSNFESRSVTFFNSEYLKQDKGIQKSGSHNMPSITNYYNARMNVEQKLNESRFGLEIQFTMSPKGLLLTAGSIIEITHPRFGFDAREFRITNLNFKKDGTVDITADEHDDSIYDVSEEIFTKNVGTIGKELVVDTDRPLAPSGFKNNPGVINTTGVVQLVWTNSELWDSATHSTEVFRSENADFDHTVNAADLVAGTFYTIQTKGTTDFTDVGAPNNEPGTVFMASGPATVGSGGVCLSRVLAGTSDSDHFEDEIKTGFGGSTAETRYYWIRYRVKRPQFNVSGSNFRNVFSDKTPFSGDGVIAVAYPRSFLKALQIVPGDREFSYDEDGDLLNTLTSTTITATTTNFHGGDTTFVWLKNGVIQSGETTNTYDYDAPTDVADMPETVTCRATHTLNGATEVIEDTVILSSVSRGPRGLPGTSVTIIGSISSVGSQEITYKFENNAHGSGSTEPSYTTEPLTITNTTAQNFTVDLDSQGSNTFGSLILYLANRDVPVIFDNWVLNSTGDTGDPEPLFDEPFGNATIDDHTDGYEYEFPTGAESWAGFACDTDDTFFRISLSSAGTLTFDAHLSDSQTVLNDQFDTGSLAAGNGVIAQDTGRLWVYDGTLWNDVGQAKGDDGISITSISKDDETLTVLTSDGVSRQFTVSNGDHADPAVIGYVTYISNSTITRAANGSYSHTHLDVDVEFRSIGTVVGKERYRLSRLGDGWQNTVTALTTGYTPVNEGRLTPTVSTNNQNAVVNVVYDDGDGRTSSVNVPFNLTYNGQGISSVTKTGDTVTVVYENSSTPGDTFTVNGIATAAKENGVLTLTYDNGNTNTLSDGDAGRGISSITKVGEDLTIAYDDGSESTSLTVPDGQSAMEISSSYLTVANITKSFNASTGAAEYSADNLDVTATFRRDNTILAQRRYRVQRNVDSFSSGSTPNRDDDLTPTNEGFLSATTTVNGSDALITVTYDDTNGDVATLTIPFTLTTDAVGIRTVNKSNETVTVTYDDNSTDTFTVNGISNANKDGDQLTITFDNGDTTTIDDGTPGRGISSITKVGEDLTIAYDDSSASTSLTVPNGAPAIQGKALYETVSNITKSIDNDGNAEYSDTELAVTAEFTQDTTTLARDSFKIVRNGNSWTAESSNSANATVTGQTDLNTDRVSAITTVDGTNGVITVTYTHTGTGDAVLTIPFTITPDPVGIKSVGKSGQVVTVTYDDNSTDEFNVNGISSANKDGDQLTITFDNGDTTTIDDGTAGRGISSIGKVGEALTINYDDGSESTSLTVPNGDPAIQGKAIYETVSNITKSLDNDGNAEYDDTDLQVTAEFTQDTTVLARDSFKITRNGDSWTATAANTAISGQTDVNADRVTAVATVNGTNAVITATYSHTGTGDAVLTIPFTITPDPVGIKSVAKSNSTVTVTYDDNSTDTFTVNGITSAVKNGDQLTITYDNGDTNTINDGTAGRGISSIGRSGETVTVNYDDGSQASTFTVADGKDLVQGSTVYTTVSNITKNAGTNTYSATFLDATITFQRGGTTLAKRRYRIERHEDSWTTGTPSPRDGDITDELNTGSLSAEITADGTNGTLTVTYTEGTDLAVVSTPFTITTDPIGIKSVAKIDDTVTVTYDDDETDTFTVNGITSASKDGDQLTITFDNGDTTTVDDGTAGRGISSIGKLGETLTINYDDGSNSQDFTVADGKDTVQGSVVYETVSNITKSVSDANVTYSATELNATVTFQRDNTILAKRKYKVSRNGDSWSTGTAEAITTFSNQNTDRLTATVTADGTNAILSVEYDHSNDLSVFNAPFTITPDPIGIASVSKTGQTVTVTYDDDSTDEFNVNGISSATKDGDRLTITFDNGDTTTIDDGTAGRGISSITRVNDVVTVAYDDGSQSSTYDVEDGKDAIRGDVVYVTNSNIIKSFNQGTGAAEYSHDHLDITALFIQAGTTIAFRRYRVERDGDSWSSTVTNRDQDIVPSNANILSPSIVIDGTTAMLQVQYQDANEGLAIIQAPITITTNAIGIRTVSKSNETVTVTLDSGATQTFDVVGVSAAEKVDGVVTLTFDDNETLTVNDGVGISDVTKVGETVTVEYTDGSESSTFDIADGKDAIQGSIEYTTVSNILKSTSSEGVVSYDANQLDVTVLFSQEGTALARRRYRVVRNGDSWTTGTPEHRDADTTDELNTSTLTPTVTANGRNALLSVAYDGGTIGLANVSAPFTITPDPVGIATVTKTGQTVTVTYDDSSTDEFNVNGISSAAKVGDQLTITFDNGDTTTIDDGTAGRGISDITKVGSDVTVTFDDGSSADSFRVTGDDAIFGSHEYVTFGNIIKSKNSEGVAEYSADHLDVDVLFEDTSGAEFRRYRVARSGDSWSSTVTNRDDDFTKSSFANLMLYPSITVDGTRANLVVKYSEDLGSTFNASINIPLTITSETYGISTVAKSGQTVTVTYDNNETDTFTVNGVTSAEKEGTQLTITFDDGDTVTIDDGTNGNPGRGISSVERVLDTVTVSYDDNSADDTYTVTDGADAINAFYEYITTGVIEKTKDENGNDQYDAEYLDVRVSFKSTIKEVGETEFNKGARRTYRIFRNKDAQTEAAREQFYSVANLDSSTNSLANKEYATHRLDETLSGGKNASLLVEFNGVNNQAQALNIPFEIKEEARGIQSISKSDDTVTITYNDADTDTFTVNGISSAAKVGDQLTITFDNGDTTTIDDGDSGRGISDITKDGEDLTIAYDDGSASTSLTVPNGAPAIQGKAIYETVANITKSINGSGNDVYDDTELRVTAEFTQDTTVLARDSFKITRNGNSWTATAADTAISGQSDVNASRVTAVATVNGTNAVITATYSHTGTGDATLTIPFTITPDPVGIKSVDKSGQTVTVTYDDNETDTFTVNGITSTEKNGDQLTITYDNGNTTTIDDGTPGRGISSITKVGEDLTIAYDDSSASTSLTVPNGAPAIQGKAIYNTVANITKSTINGNTTYSANHLLVTAEFTQDTTALARDSFKIFRSGDTFNTIGAVAIGGQSDLNTTRITTDLNVSGTDAIITATYSHTGTGDAVLTIPFTITPDPIGIKSVDKSGETVTVTYDDNETDTFTVNGVTSANKAGDQLTITFDDGESVTIDDGDTGRGIQSVNRVGDTVTVAYDDNSADDTYTVTDGQDIITVDSDLNNPIIQVNPDDSVAYGALSDITYVVYEGTTPLTFKNTQNTASLANGQYLISSTSDTNITAGDLKNPAADDGDTEVTRSAPTAGFNINTPTATIVTTFKIKINGSIITRSHTQFFSAQYPSKSVQLVTGDPLFATFNAAGTKYQGISSYTFTANTIGMQGVESKHYRYEVIRADGTSKSNSSITNNTFTLNLSASATTANSVSALLSEFPLTISVKVCEGSSPAARVSESPTIIAEDSISIGTVFGATEVVTTATNLAHTFFTQAGVNPSNDFVSDVTVLVNGQEQSFTTNQAATNSYRYGIITNSAGVTLQRVGANAADDRLEISDSSTLITNESTKNASATVEIIQNGTNTKLGLLSYSFNKVVGTRGSREFVVSVSDHANLTAAVYDKWRGTLDDNAAGVVVQVLFAVLDPDNLIAGDKVTLSDPGDDTPVTARIYQGPTVTGYGSQDADYWSSIVSTFIDGSAIVENTLSAEALLADSSIVNALRVRNTITIGDSATPDTQSTLNGSIITKGKTSYGNSTAGAHISVVSGVPKFDVGTNNEYIRFDGTAVDIKSTGGGFDLRSATSGSRVEITGDTIKVFDGNNERVRIGNLS